MGIPMGDLAGSLYAAFSISAALYHRDKTGEGRKIELSLLDCLISLHTYVSQYYFSGGEISGPIGSGHLSVVPYRAFATKDKPLVIAIFVEKFWKVLCDTIGDTELGEDPRLASSAGRLEHREEVDSRVQAKLLEKTREEWLDLLREAQVPCAPILSIDEVFEDPQVKNDEMRVETDHPHCGKLPVTGDPIKQTPKPDGGFVPSPLLGQHTDEVLTDLAGLSPEQIEQLRAKKIV
jgi:CoA:oxalate CoA-transferase